MNGVIGEIRGFGGNFAPRFWSYCQGQLISIAQNTALFSILGTTYGGDGRSTFALPDLRGRIPLSEGRGPGLSPRPLGQRSGQEDVILNVLQIPSHFHFTSSQAGAVTGSATATMNVNDTSGSQTNPDNNFLGFESGSLGFYDAASDGSTLATDAITFNTATMALNSSHITVSNTGSNHDHNNLQPYTVINWIICMQGVFPSRS